MTKYEQITELRDTATLINQLEFKMQMMKDNLELLRKYNSHGENSDLITDGALVLAGFENQMTKLKTVFDLLLSNIKPYNQ